MTGDRTHYHGDGCTPPHPAATLAEALWVKFGPVLPPKRDAAEVLRLLASGECDELNAAVADAVAANPEAYGIVNIPANLETGRPGVIVVWRGLVSSEQADQEGRADG